jgi:hypothetical protein
MSRGRRAFALSLLLVATLGFAPRPGTAAAGGGEDLAALARAVGALERRVELLQLSADRWQAFASCLRSVPVSEHGDPDRQWGYVYDERDGSGPGHMPALAVDRRRRAGRADYRFLAVRRGGGCASAAPEPGGSAEAASVRATASRRPSVRGLERRVTRLERTVRRLSGAVGRFDAWETCVSQLPVTEYGDPDGGFGYAFGPLRAASFAYRPALAIDRSDRDDPDYLLLAFVGGDRPGHDCLDEPAEDAEAAVLGSGPERVEDLQGALDALTEDVEDLREPVRELDLFQECAYVVGATQRGGYRYEHRGLRTRPALAFDLRGSGLARYQFLAFPAEEPPSLECNEDADEEDAADD